MGRFVLTDTGGGIYFSLLGDDGKELLHSQIYKTEMYCRSGIRSVRKNSQARVENLTVPVQDPCKCPKFEIYRDDEDVFRFRLRAKNGQLIAHSVRGFNEEEGWLRCILEIRRIAKKAQEEFNKKIGEAAGKPLEAYVALQAEWNSLTGSMAEVFSISAFFYKMINQVRRLDNESTLHRCNCQKEFKDC